MKRLWPLLLLLIWPARMWGACPSGANYLNPATNSLVTLSSLGVTTCIYYSSSGSESNSGADESHPKQYLPGMSGATTTPFAGTGLIVEGGSVYHAGNSGASPYTGGTWTWVWSGTSANPIYIGVDPAWYSGGSWARPILTGDNATTTSTTLSGCSYQVSSANVMFSNILNHYLYWDNFELTGMCQSHLNAPFAEDVYVQDNASTYFVTEHLYVHGSSHKQFSCTTSGGEPVGMCFSAFVFSGSNGSGAEVGNQHLYDVLDFTDSDPAGWGQIYDPMFTMAYSVMKNGSNVVISYQHTFHDNLVENWVDPGDGIAHGNIYEEVGEPNGTNAIYNNLFVNGYNTGIQGVCFWPSIPTSGALYVFNNLWYNVDCGGNYINIGQNSGNQGPMYLFNNTMENPQNGAVLTCAPSGHSEPFTSQNNHFITDAGTPYNSYCGSGTKVTDLLMTHSTATAQGYTSSETYPYSPTGNTNSTVGYGTNANSTFCAALSTAAGSDPTLTDAATKCASDTTVAISYNSSTHTVSYPRRTSNTRPATSPPDWDAGAYQNTSSGSAPVITSSTISTCAINISCSYQITASNSPTSYSASGLPATLTINTATGLIGGVPTALATYTITLGATNGSGTGNATLTLTVGQFVQTGAGTTCNSTSSCSFSFNSNPITGDTLLIPFTYPSGPTVTGVTDSQGNSYSLVGSPLTSAGGNVSQVWVAKNIVGGSDVVTIQLSSSASFIIVLPAEYTGVNKLYPVDVTAGATGSAGAVSSGSATTTVGGDVIFGYAWSDTGAVTVGSGFTSRSTFDGNLTEDQTQATAGSYAATGTATGTWTMQVVALRPILSVLTGISVFLLGP